MAATGNATHLDHAFQQLAAGTAGWREDHDLAFHRQGQAGGEDSDAASNTRGHSGELRYLEPEVLINTGTVTGWSQVGFLHHCMEEAAGAGERRKGKGQEKANAQT